jgi:hypothetical protein
MMQKIKESLSFFYKIRFSKVKYNENIFIFGISRGGTTLLAEALVSILNARLVWEPLFPYRKVFLESINPFSTHRYNTLKMGWYPHVAHRNQVKVDTYFERLFALKERNIRFYRYTNYQLFSKQESTVFKFCFANFMYPYFNQKFASKSIVLLRHPFAIASSSLNFGNNYNWHKENYDKWRYSDNPWSGDFFKQYETSSHLINSAFALIVYQATTQFSYILSQINKENTIIVFYEDLVTDSDNVFKELASFFGKELDASRFKLSLSKQSFSSSKGHTHQNEIAQLSKWQKHTTKEDIEQGLKIFEALDFKVYSNDILPLKE